MLPTFAKSAFSFGSALDLDVLKINVSLRISDDMYLLNGNWSKILCHQRCRTFVDTIDFFSRHVDNIDIAFRPQYLRSQTRAGPGSGGKSDRAIIIWRAAGEKFFYKVKQHKKNSVTGNARSNPTRDAQMASDNHDNNILRRQPYFFASNPSGISLEGRHLGQERRTTAVYAGYNNTG